LISRVARWTTTSKASTGYFAWDVSRVMYVYTVLDEAHGVKRMPRPQLREETRSRYDAARDDQYR